MPSERELNEMLAIRTRLSTALYGNHEARHLRDEMLKLIDLITGTGVKQEPSKTIAPVALSVDDRRPPAQIKTIPAVDDRRAIIPDAPPNVIPAKHAFTPDEQDPNFCKHCIVHKDDHPKAPMVDGV